ncbi:amine oxidase, partial [Methylobacterium radiotolerans]
SFAPFFGGIFLNRELETSARLFRYYFRMLMEGGPAGLWPTLTAGALTLGDKLRVAKLALHLKGPAPEALLQGLDESTRGVPDPPGLQRRGRAELRSRRFSAGSS